MVVFVIKSKENTCQKGRDLMQMYRGTGLFPGACLNNVQFQIENMAPPINFFIFHHIFHNGIKQVLINLSCTELSL